MKSQSESTYALLVRSEDTGRAAIEILIYALLVFNVVILLWQFALEPVKVPAVGLQPADDFAHDSATEQVRTRS